MIYEITRGIFKGQHGRLVDDHGHHVLIEHTLPPLSGRNRKRLRSWYSPSSLRLVS